MVPEKVLQVIHEYLGDAASRDVSITHLSGGHSCANFLVETESTRWVLRYNEKASPLRFQCELFAMEKAAQLGIAPLVLEAFPDNKMVLIEYIDEKTLTIEQALEIENCVKLAQGLRKAHTIPKNPYHGLPRHEIMKGFYQTLLGYPEIREETTEAIQLIREGHQKVQNMPSSYSVNTHNDLNPGNIFLTNKGVVFIDWEGTNWEDPFYDLSYFAIFHDYPKTLEGSLLKSYLGRDPFDEEYRRYHLTKMTNFARISTSCYFIAAHVQQSTWDHTLPLEHWGHYVRALAHNHCNGLPTGQFFYHLAKTALQQAIRLSSAEESLRPPYFLHEVLYILKSSVLSEC